MSFSRFDLGRCAATLLALSLTCLSLAPSCHSTAQAPVYVLDGRFSQPVSSSTLRWATAEGGARPEGAVKAGQNMTDQFHVCRAAQRGGGHFHAGYLDKNVCRIIIGDQVLSFGKYQVLVNVDASARLDWVAWHQFTGLPKGAVYVDENVIVARAWVKENRREEEEESGGAALVLTPGGLYLQRQYGLIMVAVEGGTHEQQKHTNGQILVEREPVKYELSDFFRGRQTSESKREVDVANQQIFIRGSPPAPPGREEEERKNGHTFNVSFEQRFYFGRGHSIPTGSPVRVRFRDRPALALVWGMEKREPVKRQVRITYPIPEGTRVRVSLAAQEIKRKFEFSATLMTHFEDGAILMRPVKGRYQMTTLDRFAPIFSQPVALRDLTTTAAPTAMPLATTTTMLLTRSPKLKRARTMGREAKTKKTKPGSMIKSYRYPLDEAAKKKDEEKQQRQQQQQQQGHRQVASSAGTAATAASVAALSLLWSAALAER